MARGSLYLAIVLGVLGFVFLAAGIPMGGWYNRTGALTMAVGAVAFVAAAWLLISAQAASETQAIARNPIPPTADSVANGQMNYERHCLTCHGEHGLGDGPGGVGLEPPPADLSDTCAAARRRGVVPLCQRGHRRHINGSVERTA